MSRWMTAAVLMGLLLPPAPADAAPPKLSPESVRLQLTGQAVEAGGLAATLQIRDRCIAAVSKTEAQVDCSEWQPLEAEAPARKLAYKGPVDVSGKTRNVNLRATTSGGEAYVVQARLGASWHDLVADPEGPGRWILPAAVAGVWILADPDKPDWDLHLRAFSAETPVPFDTGGKPVLDAPTKLTTGDRAPHADAWTCAGLGRAADDAVYLEAGLRPARVLALAAEHEGLCAPKAKAVREGVCRTGEGLAHALAQSGDLEVLLALKPDVEAFVSACPDHHKELAQAGTLAREYFVTVQRSADLVRFLSAYREALGLAWLADGREAAAKEVLQEARRTGQTEPITVFLEAFPRAADAPELGRALLQLSARIKLPCGSRRGCDTLEAGQTLAAGWTDPPGVEAQATLLAWSRADGTRPLAETFGGWARGADPAAIEAVVASLAGEAKPGSWTLTLPFPLRQAGEGHDGYALQLTTDGIDPVVLPFEVGGDYGEFTGRSRAIVLAKGQVSRVDEPGGKPARLAAVEVSATNHLIAGRHLYVWTQWTPTRGVEGPKEPIGLVRVDLEVGGLEVILAGEPVTNLRTTGRDLLVDVGAGCSLGTAIAAGRSKKADADSHPGAAQGPPTSECRTAILVHGETALGEAPSPLPSPKPAPAEGTAPEGTALVTDRVAEALELFLVEQATGRRVQLSQAHRLRKDWSNPTNCATAEEFTTRWYDDGRLVVHHGLSKCGDGSLRGPLALVDPDRGVAVELASDSVGMPAWVATSWAPDRKSVLTADGAVVRGNERTPGPPGVIAAYWYRPLLQDVLR